MPAAKTAAKPKTVASKKTVKKPPAKVQKLKDNPHEWATRITRLFAVFAEKNKELLKEDKVKPKIKAG